MSKRYRSAPVNCSDSTVTVVVDPFNHDGIVILEGLRSNYGGEGTKVMVDFEVDADSIDDLIEYLQEAKKRSQTV